ncbi:MAG TPA: HAD family hydrolase [Methylomirabilota bacterium]|nr:HAD family hydrolase [Methylomirabilota bacterium]
MLFKALACDYDGTLASEDRIGQAALSALEQARQAGLRLILVTGRTFFELTRVCERLDLFDAVVAENGGVIYFPGPGVLRDQAPPPPSRLLAELDRRGISFQAGRVIVGVGRGDEEKVNEALGAAGVNLQRCYNRAALMLVPAGISKGEGVRLVIRELGLSFHDVLALGDAENDVDFFEACGWAGCPANAVPALWERADWIFSGDDGEGIAQAIAGPILHETLPLPRSSRHRITLGWAVESSEPVTIPARGVNMLVLGDPLAGKSWLTGGVIEHLISRDYAVCVFDPEGDFQSLRRLPGVIWGEIQDKASLERAVDQFDRNPLGSVVMDLASLPHAMKVRMIEKGLELVHLLRRGRGLPHWVVLDEAHYSLHREGVADRSIGLEDKGFCLVSYKGSWIRELVLKAMDVLILARMKIPEELGFLRRFLDECSGMGTEAASILPALPRGEFLIVQPDDETAKRTTLTFVATPRELPHVRHLKKYADSRVPAEHRFSFRHPDGRLAATAESLNEFRRKILLVDDDALTYHTGRGDFSRWVLDIFSDQELARDLRKTERRYCRGEISDLRAAIGSLIAVRYGAEQ